MNRKSLYGSYMVAPFLIVAFLFGQPWDTVFNTADGRFGVSAPDDWQVLDLNDAADIQIGNMQKEQYLILLSENKMDLYGWNLQKHSYVTLGNLAAGLSDPVIKGPFDMEINENSAIQYELEGSAQGLRIVYLHTTVETDSAFNQMLAWTLRSKYNENKNLLKAVINTFNENK